MPATALVAGDRPVASPAAVGGLSVAQVTTGGGAGPDPGCRGVGRTSAPPPFGGQYIFERLPDIFHVICDIYILCDIHKLCRTLGDSGEGCKKSISDSGSDDLLPRFNKCGAAKEVIRASGGHRRFILFT